MLHAADKDPTDRSPPTWLDDIHMKMTEWTKKLLTFPVHENHWSLPCQSLDKSFLQTAPPVPVQYVSAMMTAGQVESGGRSKAAGSKQSNCTNIYELTGV